MSGLLLIDECMSPRLVPLLWEAGVDTIHVRDRGLNGAADHTVWQLAQDQSRTVCTINRGDFVRLAGLSVSHAGLIVVPSGGSPSMQFDWVMAAVSWVKAANTDTGFLNRFIEIDEAGALILSEVLCAICE